MGFIGEWRASRARRRRAKGYLHDVLGSPESTDIEWLSGITGDVARAERELVFARRALALIVAERDALDDRTASEVAHVLAGVIETEARESAANGAEWTARRRTYTAAMAARGNIEAPATRLGRVLLEGAGVARPTGEVLERAAQFVLSTRTKANEALRAVFGVASLPEDVRPSAMRP